jgi:26S proteasome regulatory subunit N3
MGEDDQSHANGSKSAENGVNGSEDVEMGEDTAGAPTSSFNSSKDRNGDEKMTVVVPPTKGSRSSGKPGQDKEKDVTMEGAEDDDAEKAEHEVDPTTKAIQGGFDLLLLVDEGESQALHVYTY